MGWLHWSEEQTLWADVNAIRVGYEGQVEWLQGIFGKPEEGPGPPKPGKGNRSKDALPVIVGTPTGGGGKPITFSSGTFDGIFGEGLVPGATPRMKDIK